MKKIFLIATIFLCISPKSYCQISDSDITITTKGLSQDYDARFKDKKNKEAFSDILNKLDVPQDIAPIKLIVNYENGEGSVTAEINYNHDKIFSDSEYDSHNNRWSRWGTGISVYLQHKIFTALSQYKKSVATEGYQMENAILKFDSNVKCKKSNGDFIVFYAYNNLNSQGFYPYTFYKNAHISILGKIYEAESANTTTLNEVKFFIVGKTIGLDGNKTGAYYFCKFFDIKTD